MACRTWTIPRWCVRWSSWATTRSLSRLKAFCRQFFESREGDMMSINRRKLMGASLAVGWGAASAQALAQAAAWPAKPIRLVVPYPPGGSSDIIARAIAQPLSEALKQPVIVDNKAGANGNLGADFVAKSAPDGYTLLLCDTGALAISPSVYTRLGFDPSKDLRGVTMLAYSPHLLVVHPSVQASNLKE